MEIFPAQYSTLSSAALNNRLQQAYNLEGTHCRLLLRNVSDTYILENETSKYIFKIYRDAHRKLEEINGEVELLNKLKERGGKVSYPIKDRDGNFLQAFNAAEGTRYGVLFSYASGSVFSSLTDEQLETVGREMALIHNITSSLELNFPRKEYSINSTIIQPLIILKPAFKGLGDEYNWLSETADSVLKKLQQFNLEEFSYGYCHYDFMPKNFHLDHKDNITFFDFDFAGKGYLANDLMSFYMHYFFELHFNRITREEADRAFYVFIEAYRKVRTLTDEELKSIRYLGFGYFLFYLSFTFENFDDWSNIFFSSQYLKGRVAMIKNWMNNFGEL